MGNEASTLLKLRKGASPPLITDCEKHSLPYRKKSKRNVSRSRFNKDSKSPDCETPNSERKGSGDGLRPPIVERRRSRSLCATHDKEGSTGGSPPKTDDKGMGRKNSSGLVPSLNRLRIQQCYRSAKPTMGESILRRASGARTEFRQVFSRLKDDEYDVYAKQMHALIADAVAHLDDADEVLANAHSFGESFASLCPIGFRPDLFSVLADAAIAECVKLDGATHKRCDTLQAWSQLISALFTAVRDGYYSRVRYQRRSSLPQHTVSKQVSMEVRSLQHQESFGLIKE